MNHDFTDIVYAKKSQPVPGTSKPWRPPALSAFNYFPPKVMGTAAGFVN